MTLVKSACLCDAQSSASNDHLAKSVRAPPLRARSTRQDEYRGPQPSIDPAIYYDPQRFDAERERLFRRLPLCPGHADQLAERCAVLAMEVCGTPVLIARGSDDELRVS
jgi:hypothetical protein